MKNPFRVFFTVLVATALLYGCGQDKSHHSSHDESTIERISDDYVKAFNERDTSKLSRLMTDDVVFIDLNHGELIEGKEELANYFQRKFEEDVPSLEITINSVTFNDPEHARAKGDAVVSYTTKPPEQKAFYADFVKIDQGWLLEKITEINLSQELSQLEHLNKLDWLIGNWIDSDDDVSLVLSYEWDKSKNFLIQHFTMQILDHKQIEGVQIIGWDPSNERIRSWIFDSDGGFGEGVWSEDGNDWYVKVSFTMANGQKASATHVYTNVDENTYSFASENRAIDGSLLPNIGPFEVVRQDEGSL